MQNESAEAVISCSKKLEDALQEIGFKIKHHDANIKFLKAQKNRLDDSILDMGGALAKIHSASGTGSENKESSNGQNEEDTIEQIIRYEKSAAGICCQLQTRYRTQITQIPFVKDVIGVVALLGKVDDDNLSRLKERRTVQLLLSTSCSNHQNLNNCISNMLMTYLARLHFLERFGLTSLAGCFQHILENIRCLL